MIKRPSAQETEDDLLKLQNDYLQSKQKPAATVKRIAKRDVIDLSEKGLEASSETKKPTVKPTYQERKALDELRNPSARLDAKDEVHHISSVLKKITEKPVSDFVFANVRQYRDGFPSVPTLNKNGANKPTKTTKTTKKKSLFAQQFALYDRKKDLGQENGDENIEDENLDKNEEVDSTKVDNNTVTILAESDVVETPEKKGIHIENKEKLKSMSETEILQERGKLLESLDPKLVAFLKTRNVRGANQKPSEPQKKEEYVSESTSCYTNTKGKTENKNKNKQEECINPYQEFDINKNYVNMNDVEKEKLEWMKTVPKITLQEEDSVTPRFDFEGNLLPPDQDVPSHLGLHHHGNEPSLPGYSLEELFQMIRSNFLQQRSIGLLTLSKIMKKYHHGCFVQKLSTNLLQTCLNAGLVFVLRWSLDEQTEQIYSGSLSALANIVYIEKDQEAVERLSYCEDGFKLPSLCTYFEKKSEQMTKEEKEEQHDLTDAELMYKDVIKALIQMRILPRLRYLLEMCELSESAVRNLLCILQRIIQHGNETAYEVYKCPGMLAALMTMIKRKEPVVVEGVLKTFRSLFIAGRNMAHNFISSHPALLEFIAARFSSFSFVGDDISVYIQVCKLWSLLLSYGLSQQLVRDLYPVLLQHVQKCSANYTTMNDTCLASLLLLLKHVFRVSEEKEVERNIVEGLYPLVQLNLQTVLTDVIKNEKITHPLYLTSLISCATHYFTTKNMMVSVAEPVSLLNEVAKFWDDHIFNMLNSMLMKQLLIDASAHSDFIPSKNSDHNISSTQLVNLPCYGTSCFLTEPVPSIMLDSPVMLLQALTKTLLELISINKQLVLKVRKFITSPELVAWLGCFTESQYLKRCTVLVTTRIELLTISHCVDIYHRVVTCYGLDEISSDVNTVYLQCASRLVCLLQPGDEALSVAIIRNVLFNEKIVRNKQYVLWVSDNTSEDMKKQIDQHLKTSLQYLQRIGSMYERNLFPNFKNNNERKIESHLTPSLSNKILPSDWMLYPIVQLYNESINLELSGKMISRASNDALFVLQDCLRYLLLLEVTRPSLLTEISETLRFTRLMCVFLTEGDLYAEGTARDLLVSLLSVYSSTVFQSYLDFEQVIPGITSFYDLYSSLLQQYLSSSYGDHVFSNIILIPMQLTYPVKYRRAIWTEHASLLRVFPIPLNKILLDVNKFFAEEQEDIEMIRLYFKMYTASRLKKQWCPLFYAIAVHHIAQFIFNVKTKDTPEKGEGFEDLIHEEKRRMLKRILELKDVELRDDIVYYKIFDKDTCLTRFQQLPPSREMMLRDAVK